MQFPEKAIFAFNANIDHLIFAGESSVEVIDRAHPDIASAMAECFATGVQKEIQIDLQVCRYLLANFQSRKIVGGQAGNAADQASALGVDCFLHTNFGNDELLGLFSYPERIRVACEKSFCPAGHATTQAASAHHFVFENSGANTRFICSFDPFPIHPEPDFCGAITMELPRMKKAFVGGMHLVKTIERARKLVDEIRRWKEVSPNMQVFFEMGEFQNQGTLDVVRKELFPVVDIVGLNEVELAALGCTPEELAEEAASILLHTHDMHGVYPKEKENPSALEFARKCAAFKAKTGKCGDISEVMASEAVFVENPAWTVGLGDALSCGYFMATP